MGPVRRTRPKRTPSRAPSRVRDRNIRFCYRVKIGTDCLCHWQPMGFRFRPVAVAATAIALVRSTRVQLDFLI